MGGRDSRLGQRHVDGGRVEDGPRGDEDDLDEEGDEVERVLVQEDAGCISDNLDEAPDHHEGHEAPGSAADAEHGVDCEGEGEEGEQDGVCGQRWTVLVDAGFNGTCGERAVGVGAKADAVVR